MFIVSAVLWQCVLLAVLAGSYQGHKVVQIGGYGKAQDRFLEEMECDVWAVDEEHRLATVHLSPEQYEAVLKNESLFGEVTVIDENLQQSLDFDAIQNTLSKSIKDKSLWFQYYHSYEDIKAWYEELARTESHSLRLYPSIGRSVESRDIFGVRIALPADQLPKSMRSTSRKKIYIQCLIHAREWISGSVCQYLTKSLLEGVDTDVRVAKLLLQAEIYLVPVVNPDGYVHSWKKDRLWRKNRNGHGVDLNRNFADHWGMAGASKLPSSLFYCGASAESEPETRAVKSFFRKAGKVDLALDFHSYSQLVMRPPAWSSAPSRHERHLKMATDIMSRAMYSINRRHYNPQRAAELYENSGSATDWFYAQGTRYSLTVELPPSAAANQGEYGFMWGPEKIESVCREAWEGFLAVAEFALHNPLQ